MTRARWRSAIVATTLAAACSPPPTQPNPTPTPAAATITITTTGVTPKNVQIALGQRVLFINNDTRDHNVGSDPHPDHNECPSINQVGILKPGEQRETSNFVVVRTCGFHDHDDPTYAGMWGSIVTK